MEALMLFFAVSGIIIKKHGAIQNFPSDQNNALVILLILSNSPTLSVTQAHWFIVKILYTVNCLKTSHMCLFHF